MLLLLKSKQINLTFVFCLGRQKSQEWKTLLSGSSHEWEFGPMLQEHLGTAYEIASNLKPKAPVGNVTEKLWNLGNDLTKRDHIIRVGGPGNSLDRNYHCSIEKDINFTAERTHNTNIRFVNILRKHGQP
jgi:hypothetical protein